MSATVTPIGLPSLTRPAPPAILADPLRLPGHFEPAHELGEWAISTFVDAGGILENLDHEHLRGAHIGFVWTNWEARRGMRQIVGEASVPQPAGSNWSKALVEWQLQQWFGAAPDFRILIDAPYAATADDWSFCSLIEHELYHYAQARRRDGEPRFRKDGSPIYALQGHDVEEFVGVTARYGVGASAGRTADLVRVANRGPTIAAATIASACGTCRRRAA